jgi:tetratricopeptide (TPR) repeat protein
MALQLLPDNSEILDARGHVLEALGRHKEAIADFRRVQAIDPEHQGSREALKRLGATH